MTNDERYTYDEVMEWVDGLRQMQLNLEDFLNLVDNLDYENKILREELDNLKRQQEDDHK